MSLIPKGTEKEKVYQLTWHDLHTSDTTSILLCCVVQCGNPHGLYCCKLSELLADETVAEYLWSDDIRHGQVPVQKDMCNNFQGWGDFSRNALGIDWNSCKQHATGNVLYIALRLSARQADSVAVAGGITAYNIPMSSTSPLVRRTLLYNNSYDM